jgi:hypothetical protein
MSPAISDIEWAVCTKYRVTPAQLGGDCRARFHSNPRQILLYLLRTLTEMSLPRIGSRYNRDHTTVIAAVKAVRARMEASPAYAADIAEIIAAIPSGEMRLQNDREWAEKLKAGVYAGWCRRSRRPLQIQPYRLTRTRWPAASQRERDNGCVQS